MVKRKKAFLFHQSAFRGADDNAKEESKEKEKWLEYKGNQNVSFVIFYVSTRNSVDNLSQVYKR
jgi:hypothetical protein